MKKKTLSKNFHDDLYTSIKWSQADGCKECKTICTYKMYKYTDVSVPIKYTKGRYLCTYNVKYVPLMYRIPTGWCYHVTSGKLFQIALCNLSCFWDIRDQDSLFWSQIFETFYLYIFSNWPISINRNFNDCLVWSPCFLRELGLFQPTVCSRKSPYFRVPYLWL